MTAKKGNKDVKKPQKKAKKPNANGGIGGKGRKTNGQFAKGHRHSAVKHKPSNRKAQKLKDAMLAAVSAADIKNIIKKQVEKAKAGDNDSAKIVFDRCLGRPKETEEGRTDIPTTRDKVPVDEIMSHYFLTLQKLPLLGGVDIKSVEGNRNGNKQQ